jgi:DNA mismatch repair protein MutL
MGKVRTLRDDVFKKIAAGEVVERPLSVVKELVENAIDAGADTIDVEIEEGGKRMIKVDDNGSGFAPEDIETAFKNHSTSKISELEDFNSLNTLGFRGEALPSILEVSKIELQTSDNSKGQGIYCLMEGGKEVERRGISCAMGTSIQVKELFYNFPVRKKFLKTDRTELNQIVSFLEPMTLVHFDKSFQLIHNNKTVFSYKKTGSLKERLYQVFGKDFLDSLQEVDFVMEPYRLNGFVSRLNTGVSVKKHQYFFVNHRPVREKTLVAALNNTFQKFLEKSRNPVGVLMMEIPPREVDVNIHPMKLEIKFENSGAIYKFIKNGIESSFGVMDDFSAALPADDFRSSSDRTNTYGTGGGNTGGPFSGSRSTQSSGGFTIGRQFSGLGGGSGSASGVEPGEGTGAHTSGGTGIASVGQTQGRLPLDDYRQSQLFTGKFTEEETFTIIGQYKNSYIVAEKDGDLLVVDQHNAQERVNFDQLKKEYAANGVASINPLFPVIMELTPSEKSKIDEKKLELMEKLGFRLESLGGNSIDIKSFPQILGEKNVREAVRTVIHLNVTSKEDEVSFEDGVLAEVACKSAIKVNHKLHPDQMKTIVTNLFKTSNPYFCPHKRPIIIEFTLEEIEKMLKRR